MMPPEIRRKAFRAALALDGMTQEEWAQRDGISGGHLTHCLFGRRKSKVLFDRIDKYVRETFNRILKLPGVSAPR